MLNVGDELLREEPNQFDTIFTLDQSLDELNPNFAAQTFGSCHSVSFNSHKLLQRGDGDTSIKNNRQEQSRYSQRLSSRPALLEFKEEDDVSSDFIKIEEIE